eukprot:TRINITY_DN26851_c0_g1_i1.p1 TRINITY_DN26851_c0_g1~~TRINITY_DN26851_c0_g1_i1.p1  ORF type:complete len:191 (+),score=9.42 TRINITY_DN26851_c0_g1_i1:116-688(+)
MDDFASTPRTPVETPRSLCSEPKFYVDPDFFQAPKTVKSPKSPAPVIPRHLAPTVTHDPAGSVPRFAKGIASPPDSPGAYVPKHLELSLNRDQPRPPSSPKQSVSPTASSPTSPARYKGPMDEKAAGRWIGSLRVEQAPSRTGWNSSPARSSIFSEPGADRPRRIPPPTAPMSPQRESRSVPRVDSQESY